MNYQSMTNSGIAAELGSRLERMRLETNMTQMALADEIGITAKSYRQLIAGGGKVENLIAALRGLNCLNQLDNFLPARPPSPLEQLKLRGKQRQRARNSTRTGSNVSSPDAKNSAASNDQKLDW